MIVLLRILFFTLNIIVADIETVLTYFMLNFKCLQVYPTIFTVKIFCKNFPEESRKHRWCDVYRANNVRYNLFAKNSDCKFEVKNEISTVLLIIIIFLFIYYLKSIEIALLSSRVPIIIHC